MYQKRENKENSHWINRWCLIFRHCGNIGCQEWIGLELFLKHMAVSDGQGGSVGSSHQRQICLLSSARPDRQLRKKESSSLVLYRKGMGREAAALELREMHRPLVTPIRNSTQINPGKLPVCVCVCLNKHFYSIYFVNYMKWSLPVVRKDAN